MLMDKVYDPINEILLPSLDLEAVFLQQCLQIEDGHGFQFLNCVVWDPESCLVQRCAAIGC